MDAGTTAGLRPCVLITGASSGIGHAFADRLSGEGHDLIAVARDGVRLERLQERLSKRDGSHVEVVVADLSDRSDLRRVECIVRERALVMLINNAGAGTYKTFAEDDPEEMDAAVALNVIAPMRLTRAALPGMIAAGRGDVVNVASISAFSANPGGGNYKATKAYIASLTEVLHSEVKDTGVRMQALIPWFIRTEIFQRAGIDVSHVPDTHWMSPEDVVQASLSGLRLGEILCVPGLEDSSVISEFTGLRAQISARLTGTLASRYRSG
ncbi:MAG: SDR family oxidoreductase [Aquisalimonadaceae bacterium]